MARPSKVEAYLVSLRHKKNVYKTQAVLAKGEDDARRKAISINKNYTAELVVKL